MTSMQPSPSRPAAPFLLPWLLAAACAVAPPPAAAAPSPDPLARRYRDGEPIAFHMTASNQDRTKTLHYTADARGVVGRNADGAQVEELDWSDLVVDGKAVALPPGGSKVHQQLSLAAGTVGTIPDLANIHPRLIGPMLDLFTFYVDLWLAKQTGRLRQGGDHVRVPRSSANSWADGAHVVLGEDAIDFDITLTALDRAAGKATVVVRHVPPQSPEIRLPAAWMREPVADGANNWVEVTKARDGYVAGVGKETFDVAIEVSLVDGRILAARMDNLVEVLERPCTDAGLEHPGEPVRYRIHRQIEIR